MRLGNTLLLFREASSLPGRVLSPQVSRAGVGGGRGGGLKWAGLGWEEDDVTGTSAREQGG